MVLTSMTQVYAAEFLWNLLTVGVPVFGIALFCLVLGDVIFSSIFVPERNTIEE